MARSLPLLAAVWALLVAISFLTLALLPADGDGFTRGLNRVMAFLGWELAALLVAIVTAILAWRVRAELNLLWRVIGFGPLVASGLGALFIAGLVVWTLVANPEPAPPPPPRPTTTPAIMADAGPPGFTLQI